MKVFEVGNTHTVRYIPRVYEEPTKIVLRDTFNDVDTELIVFSFVDGYYHTLDFSFDLEDSDKGYIYIYNNDEVIYFGQYYTTNQETQKHELTRGEYEYYE